MKTSTRIPHARTLHAFTLQVLGLLLTLLVLARCSETPVESDPPPLATTIQGIVTDEEGNGFRDVAVTLSRAGSADPLQHVTTSAQGRFVFPNLDEGTYEVTIAAPRLSEIMGANPAAVSVGEAADFRLRTLSSPALVFSRDIDPLREIRNAEGTSASAPDELIYHTNDPARLHPILAPDGHHLTLGEWQQARGSGRITCTARGTRYALALENLVPNGVYTVWNFMPNRAVTQETFPGQAPNGGALGPNTGSSNTFTATATGEGSLRVTAPPGAMSMVGEMPGCVLTETPGSFAVVLYHIDGQTWGAEPGPPATWVGHLGIIF